MTSVICTEAKVDDYWIHLMCPIPTSRLLSLFLLSSANFIVNNKTDRLRERVPCHRACPHIGYIGFSSNCTAPYMYKTARVFKVKHNTLQILNLQLLFDYNRHIFKGVRIFKIYFMHKMLFEMLLASLVLYSFYKMKSPVQKRSSFNFFWALSPLLSFIWQTELRFNSLCNILL